MATTKRAPSYDLRRLSFAPEAPLAHGPVAAQPDQTLSPLASVALGTGRQSWAARPRSGRWCLLRLLPLLWTADPARYWLSQRGSGQPPAGRCRHLDQQSIHLPAALLVQLPRGRCADGQGSHSPTHRHQQSHALAPELEFHQPSSTRIEPRWSRLCVVSRLTRLVAVPPEALPTAWCSSGEAHLG